MQSELSVLLSVSLSVLLRALFRVLLRVLLSVFLRVLSVLSVCPRCVLVPFIVSKFVFSVWLFLLARAGGARFVFVVVGFFCCCCCCCCCCCRFGL